MRNTSSMNSPLLSTPLNSRHLALGARMAPFSGWNMPIQYTGILAEHHATRTRTGLFDICHMGEFFLDGPTAEADLERLLTMNVGSIAVGQCRYGFLLADDGGVLDDLTCYRLSPSRFMLVVNAGTRTSDREWIVRHLSPSTQFEDRSDALAKLDVQGPSSRAALEKALNQSLPDLKYFRFAETTLGGIPMLISRTGYTGEWGYELYFDAELAGDVWDRFLAAGDMVPVGLGARDTLRLEVGYPLYGHELGTHSTPVGATRGAFIDTSKHFIGKSSVMRDLEHCPRLLVGLLLEGRQAARADAEVWSGDSHVGIVTSGSIAPSLDRAVALALVDSAVALPGTSLDIVVRGKKLASTIVPLPFYTQGTARGLAGKPSA